jgi:hypothetical protein
MSCILITMVGIMQLVCSRDEKFTLTNTKEFHSTTFFNESLSLVLDIASLKIDSSSSCVICDL